uniref:helix-turn-helix domain-containing protein n=1 Tax=Deinococcus sp. VB142 TaxID=3112952 RepID=UPI00403F2E6A
MSKIQKRGRSGTPTDSSRECDGLLDSREAGAFIRARMDAKGMQVQQLADRLNMGSPSQLSNLLAGRQNVARSKYFRNIVDELGLTPSEIEHLNPNIIFVHPDAPRHPVSTPERPQDLPPELRVAAKLMGELGYNLSEDTIRRLIPRELVAEGPQTREDWLDFLLGMRRFLRTQGGTE